MLQNDKPYYRPEGQEQTPHTNFSFQHTEFEHLNFQRASETRLYSRQKWYLDLGTGGRRRQLQSMLPDIMITDLSPSLVDKQQRSSLTNGRPSKASY